MRKALCLLLCAVLCCILAVPALAAPDAPVITLQPQSPNYPEYSVAIYTVKATGTNLSATWFIEYQGKTYNASKQGGSMQPWEAYAGESYGRKKLDKETFCFVFEGIEAELDGAKIWCDIEDGHHKVTSSTATITVGSYGTPPEILDIPAQLTVRKGDEAEIRCIARSGGNGQLAFVWYETATGQLSDIRAIDDGAETCDTLLCDTSKTGTRYYVCGVTTTEGGIAYSSAVAVTVEAPAPQPTQPTEAVTTPTAATEPVEIPATSAAPETSPATEPIQTPATPSTPTEGLPWWVLLLVGIAAAGIGVGTATLLVKKK